METMTSTSPRKQIDFTKLQKVTEIYRKQGAPQDFDLALSSKTKKFRLSNVAWELLRMEFNGADYYVGVDDEALLVFRPDDGSTMWERRKKQESGENLGKGNERTNRPLARHLARLYPGVENFKLEQLENHPDGPCYEIKPWDGKSGIEGAEDFGVDDDEPTTEEETTPTTPPVANVDLPAEEPEVVATTETEVDPFDLDI